MKCDLCQDRPATVHLNLMQGGEPPFRKDLCEACATQFGWKGVEMECADLGDKSAAITNPATPRNGLLEWPRLIIAVQNARKQRNEPEPGYSALDALEATVRMNSVIRAREVRVIGVDQQDLGIMPLPRALLLARSQSVDLIETGPDEVPPRCRLIPLPLYRQELREKARNDAA